MNSISSVGVVGAGTLGSALAQRFALSGLHVVLIDRTVPYVDKGLSNIHRALEAGVANGICSADHALCAERRITGSTRLDDLYSCHVVVEAAFEDLAIKTDLFRRLGAVLPTGTIVATTTSSFAVGDLAHSISRPERFLGLHYCVPPVTNRLVEIVAGARTTGTTIRLATTFCRMSGTEAILCRDRTGFAFNRFLGAWLNEASRLLDEDLADIPAIDHVCMEIFGVAAGPFALMNTMGVSNACRTQRTLESLGSFYASADKLKTHGASNTPWKTGTVESYGITDCLRAVICERMLAAVFLACGQLLDEKVCSADDLDRGACIGLQWGTGPVAMMRSRGREDVERLVRIATTRFQTPFPGGIKLVFEEREYSEPLSIVE